VTARLWMILFIAMAGVAGAALGLRQCEGDAPLLRGPQEIVVGRSGTTLVVSAEDAGTGLRSLRASLLHAEGEALLYAEDFHGDMLSGPERRDSEPIAIDPETLSLREGSAKLHVSVRDRSWRNGFRGNETVLDIPVSIDLTPPQLTTEPGLEYVQRGGAGALRYWVRDAGGRDGVQIGEQFFPGESVGTPSDRRGSPRVALFAVAVGAEAPLVVRLVAEDRAGNRTAREAPVRVRERQFPETSIVLSSRFLDGKVRELAEQLGLPSEDRVAAFQEINTRVRAENEEAIREQLKESAPKALFEGAFQQLPNSQVTSRFAERRSYRYEGKEISRATHFGYDLASFSQAPIGAGNAGRVVFAGELGIYGLCVLLDHGLGLASLYGHLSSLEVRAGDEVQQGQLLGVSGSTGLAGGDHLHFALLVRGVYVDPLEWWDPKWVREHVGRRLESTAAPAP
jgi:murein DD-endopeptidase MepM/ murein hydrolase activator NlpD